ncbi:hypothetical protein [Antrihabitans sp. YC2-6]|uniref:hypothetical protein n=1 Tax=Antrihabitans sp. YC2-6 TaxID=2799498 RepID=UPI0018F5D304|nr:hypothetical protein [Antrihabitans sp. YC2-6]MBJ8348848.1 hypothetical protein [Antrihabitans sp. YC2-6]
MKDDRAARRTQLEGTWARYYPQPLANLIAVVGEPFDNDDLTLAAQTVVEQGRPAARFGNCFR